MNFNVSGNIVTKAVQQENVTQFSKVFVNFGGFDDSRLLHIGTISNMWANCIIAGTIYSNQGYGESDTTQAIYKFMFTTLNNNIHGFLTYETNPNGPVFQFPKFYLVKTGDYSYEVYYKPLNWSSSLFVLHTTTGYGHFQFDSSDSNIVSKSSIGDVYFETEAKLANSPYDLLDQTGNISSIDTTIDCKKYKSLTFLGKESSYGEWDSASFPMSFLVNAAKDDSTFRVILRAFDDANVRYISLNVRYNSNNDTIRIYWSASAGFNWLCIYGGR